MELRPAELSAEWKKGRFRPVYYFMGEASARAEAVRELKERFKAGEFNFFEFFDLSSEDLVRNLVADALTPPMVSAGRLIIVTVARIPAAAKKTLAAYLKDPCKTTTLVLSTDDRKPEAKDPLLASVRAQGALCLFSPLRDDEAIRRLVADAQKAGKSLEYDAAQAIVEEAGTDWGILSAELKNLVGFSGSAKEIDRGMALLCLGFTKAADPFALSRLVSNRNLTGSLTQIQKTFSSGKPAENAFRSLGQINAAIFKQMRAKTMLAAGRSPASVSGSLRLHRYWDQDFLPRLGKMSETSLAADLKRCLRTDADLKSKAWLDPKLEIECLIVDLCRRPAAAR